MATKILNLSIDLEQTGGHCIAVGDALAAAIRALTLLKEKAYNDGAEAADLPQQGNIIDANNDNEVIGDWNISLRS